MIRQLQKYFCAGVDGVSLTESRQRMVQRDLVGRGIRSPAVLSAMARVPRERFVDADAAESAYDDRAQPIGCDQTISQPYIVALMSEALELSPEHRVLEIGTGSGYQTAVLAELAAEVTTVERHESLAHKSKELLEELGYKNVRFIVGDGTLGYAAGAPYDRIAVTAAGLTLPPALWQQLAEQGLIVAPLGPPEEQDLQVIAKRDGRREERTLTPCRFVPLIGTG